MLEYAQVSRLPLIPHHHHLLTHDRSIQYISRCVSLKLTRNISLSLLKSFANQRPAGNRIYIISRVLFSGKSWMSGAGSKRIQFRTA